MRHATMGFAAVIVLALTAVVALISMGTLHGALFAQQLSGSTQLMQRAGALAQRGTHAGVAAIGAMDRAGNQQLALSSHPGSTDNAQVTITHVGSGPPPAGFSSAVLSVHHFQIESTGYTAKGIRVTQVQGVTRLMPQRVEVAP
jgi:hypothetical protein